MNPENMDTCSWRQFKDYLSFFRREYPCFYPLLILSFLMVASCNSKPEADFVVVNGKVYTADSLFSMKEGFAVSEGKITETGTSDHLLSKYRAKERIDLKGKFVYPGFIDAHAHFFNYGLNMLQWANLSGSCSREEIYDLLKKHRQKNGGKWLLGRGWDQNDWPEKVFPDKSQLDVLFPEMAVYLVRIDGHAAWCNSRALELAKITKDTRIPGGEILLKEGVPSGILIDNAQTLVSGLIPEPDTRMKTGAFLTAQERCFRAGLTSITDCGVSKEIILMMDSLQKQGILKMRINAMIHPGKDELEYFMHKGIYKTSKLQVNTVKLFVDGALGSRGALLLEPYSDDPEVTGLQVSTPVFLTTLCREAYENNFQVATHCIGDSANRFMLHTYGNFLKGHNDRRWRIEHAQVLHPEDFRLFSEYSVVPSIQATHATTDMAWAGERLGEERIKNAYAYKQLLRQTGWIANGTDFPVEAIDPLSTFFASVFRTDSKGYPEGGFQMENALTREEALRSMTIWAAKASFEEKEKGSLEPGKWADFVVLDKDLMTAPPKQILKTEILSTWIGGEKVY